MSNPDQATTTIPSTTLAQDQSLWQQALPTVPVKAAPRRATSQPGEHDVVLLAAVMAGDVVAAQQALDAGANPNVFHKHERETALMGAVSNNDPSMVRLLLDAGADVNGKNTKGFQALHRCVAHDAVEMAKILFEAGATPTARTAGTSNLLDLAIAAPKSRGCPKLIIWAIEQGCESTVPSDHRHWTFPQFLMNVAVKQSSEPLMRFINRHFYGLSETDTPEDVVKKVGLKVVEEMWTVALCADSPSALHGLINTGWIAGRRRMTKGITPYGGHEKNPKEGLFWGWLALRAGCLKSFDWFMTVQGAPTLLQENAKSHPFLTYVAIHKPTVEIVKKIMESGVDLESSPAGGAAWMNTVLRLASFTKTLMTWVATHHPDWLTFSDNGQPSVVDSLRLNPSDQESQSLLKEWNVQARRRETKILQDTMNSVIPKKSVLPTRTRVRL